MADCHCNGGRVHKRFAAGAIASALLAAAPVGATVSPPTPEQIVIMDKREAFEAQARAAFSDHGLIEKLRDWRKHWGFILVGQEGSTASPRLLIKDEYGWYEIRPGETKRLPLALGHELNRLLLKSELWNEEPYNFHARCAGTPRLFVVAHAGRDVFGRLGCGPEGLAARAARVAESLRVLPGEPQTTAQARNDPPHPPGAPPGYFEASGQVSGQLFEMIAAWERKTFAGFVEPYAEDVVIEGLEGVLRGRKAVVEWARNLQDWNAPYGEGGRKLTLHQIVTKAQEPKGVFYSTHELRWEEGGKPVRQTFSTMWRNNRGLWQIAHERVSEVKPVTGERIAW